MTDEDHITLTLHKDERVIEWLGSIAYGVISDILAGRGVGVPQWLIDEAHQTLSAAMRADPESWGENSRARTALEILNLAKGSVTP